MPKLSELKVQMIEGEYILTCEKDIKDLSTLKNVEIIVWLLKALPLNERLEILNNFSTVKITPEVVDSLLQSLTNEERAEILCNY